MTESSEACTSLNSSIYALGNCDKSPQWGVWGCPHGVVCGGRSKYPRSLRETFFGLSSHMSDQSVHTYSLHSHVILDLPWHSLSPGMMVETHQYLLNLQLKLSQRLLMAPPLQHPQEDWDRELIWSSIGNCEALFSTWFSYRIPSPALPCFLLREAGPLSSLLWILLINFCICWVFCLPSFLPSFQAFSSCKKWGLNSRCCAQASHCGHFSYCRTWAL